jgi:hypothetical protein
VLTVAAAVLTVAAAVLTAAVVADTVLPAVADTVLPAVADAVAVAAGAGGSINSNGERGLGLCCLVKGPTH